MGEPIGGNLGMLLVIGFKKLWKLMRAVSELGSITGGGIMDNCGFFGG